MSDDKPDPANDRPTLLKRSLVGWANEGAGATTVPPAASASADGEAPMPENGPAELASVHVRVIALENLLISLLATASDRQLDLAREMAAYIAPRPGFTHHALTTQAAAHMVDLVERASRFRQEEPS